MQELGRTVQVISGNTGAAAKVVFGNRLLDGLPREELSRVAPALKRAILRRGAVLDADEQGAVYFPVDALVASLISTTGTGRTSALSVIGRRGAIDVSESFFAPSVGVRTTVLCSGTAWRLPHRVLEAVSAVQPRLRRMLQRYERALFAVGAARLACNSEHNVDRRVARWLLFVADETGKPQAELTHQQLAEIAAIRRPSVSLAFADLARRGILHLHHGLVQIVDRERLEREACPCYLVIRELLDRTARGT